MKKLIFTALSVALLAVGCGKRQASVSLGAHDWELYEISFSGSSGDIMSTETPPMGVTLVFNDSTMMASGRGGCNRYSAPYKTGDRNTIEFLMPVMTQMACPDMEFENRYMGWLMAVESYDVTDEQLLLTGGGATLIYKPEFK